MNRPVKQIIEPIPNTFDEVVRTVFSKERVIEQPTLSIPDSLSLNTRMKMDGRKFLVSLQANSYPVCFFDPQYRGVLDHLGYGNEGKKRGKERVALLQMSDKDIQEFIYHIHEVLLPSGHLFLWLDKFHLCEGVQHWLERTSFDTVDLIVWDKKRLGMGYRSRRVSEFLLVLQKQPRKAKGVWKVHNIPDVYSESVKKNGHTHRKPFELQAQLISAVSNEGDIIIDPAAGSFSVMDSALSVGRHFLGCDVNG